MNTSKTYQPERKKQNKTKQKIMYLKENRIFRGNHIITPNTVFRKEKKKRKQATSAEGEGYDQLFKARLS